MQKQDRKLSSLFHEKGFYLSAICLVMVLVAIGYFSRLSAVQEQQEKTAEQNKQQESLYVYPDAEGGEKKDTAVKPKTETKNTTATKKVTPATPKTTTKAQTATAEKANQNQTVAVSNSSDKKIGQAPAFIKNSLSYPVVGNILNDYTGDKLVKSKTLDEWRYHGGIDIETELNAQVKAVAGGVVEKVYMDNDLGKTVVINHQNGFKTLYANLLDNNMIKEGQEVKKDEIIGGIGKTATSEVAEAAHLHFEMFLNDSAVNPNEYLKAPAATNY